MQTQNSLALWKLMHWQHFRMHEMYQ